jgi:hypothetical protein
MIDCYICLEQYIEWYLLLQILICVRIVSQKQGGGVLYCRQSGKGEPCLPMINS